MIHLHRIASLLLQNLAGRSSNPRASPALRLRPISQMTRSMEGSASVFIDCDAGVDDAQGLVLALRDEGTNVVGIAAVNGNVNCQQVVTNIARVLKLCQANVPYHRGCDGPLLGHSLPASFWHGKDGLGDVPDFPPAVRDIEIAPSNVHASIGLVEAAKQHRGALRLVAIGPLTNIAVALKLEPALPDMLHSVTIMGGCTKGGNVTPCAEFNFHSDPEAAQSVLQAFKDVQMITWDTCQDLALDWKLYGEWLRKGRSPQADFLAEIGEIGKAHDQEEDTDSNWIVCDPLAVAAAIDPEVVKISKSAHCQVEGQGSIARGQSVFDFDAPRSKHNVRLIKEMDMEKVYKMLSDSVN